MNNLVLLTTAAQTPGTGNILITLILPMAILFVLMYFIAIRPQKKQQKQLEALIASLEVGDSVLTTAGFYGVVIDVMDEVIVVEFGNNKNCRIPMKKSSVVEVEKPGKPETAEKA